MWKLLALFLGFALVAAGPAEVLMGRPDVKIVGIVFGLCIVAAGLQLHVAFDAAGASSTYSAGNLGGSPAFAAQHALSSGSGY